jgi:hypothetical protein
MADCVLVPQVIGAKKYKVNVPAEYPTIHKVYRNMIALESVGTALADVL